MALLTFLNNSQFNSSDLSTNQLVREFISDSTNFFYETTEANEYFIENIATLSPRFKAVRFSEIDSNLANVIFINSLYDINFNNLLSALGHFFNITDEKEIRHKNYSIIYNTDDSSLRDFIESPNEIDNYVSQYISFSEEKIDDDLESIYSLINNENVSFAVTDKYISFIRVNELELDKVKYKENYPSIINGRKARANETNIMKYFASQDNKWTEELVEFVKDENAGYSFDKTKANELIKSEKAKWFFGETARNNSIPNALYEDMMMKINRRFAAFAYANISAEKIDILIKYNRIALTEKSMQTFRESYPDYLIKFILKNIDEYIENIQTIDLAEEENTLYYEELYSVLYQSDKLSIEQQKNLIDCFEVDEKISINNNHFNSDMRAYILSTHFSREDLEYVCEIYGTQPDKVEVEIYKQVKNNLLSIIDQNVPISKDLLVVLLNDEDIELDDKQLILSRNIKNVELNKLPETFNKFSLSIFTTLFDKKEPTFELNETNENILAYLVQQNVISSFDEYRGRYKAYNRAKKSRRF